MEKTFRCQKTGFKLPSFRKEDGAVDLPKISESLSGFEERDDIILKLVEERMDKKIGILVKKISHVYRLVMKLREKNILAIPLLYKEGDNMDRIPDLKTFGTSPKVFIIVEERARKLPGNVFDSIILPFIDNFIFRDKIGLTPEIVWMFDEGIFSIFYKRKFQKWCQSTGRKFIE